MRSRRNRRAFLLPGALVLILILLLLAGTRYFFSRHHLATVLRLTDGERAYQTARSALTVATDLVDRSLTLLNRRQSGTPGSPPEDLLPLLEGLAAPETLLRLEALELTIHHPLLDYLRETEQADEVEVRLHLSEARPLFPSFSGPLCMDPREHERILQVRATARYDGGRSTTVAFKTLRCTSIQLPVLGKFVLYLREADELAEAPLRRGSPLPERTAPPLVVRGGRALPAGKTLPLGEAGSWIDGQGWVFLGARKGCCLGLAGGEAADRADGLLAPTLFTWPLEEGSLLSRGGRLVYFARQEGLSKDLLGARWKEALALRSPLAHRSSPLRLCGTRKDRRPTLVLGRVHRRWALLQGLYAPSRALEAPLPYLDEGSFSEAIWPGAPSPASIERIRQQFDGSWENYAVRMSDLVEEPYNRGLLSALDLGPDEADRRLLFDSKQPPSSLIPLPRSRRLLVDGRGAMLAELQDSKALTLVDDRGRRLFEGEGLGRFADLSLLRRRSGRSFDSVEKLFEDCRDGEGRLALDGVITLEGDLDLSSPLDLAPGRGGMLLVTGSIRCRRSIRSGDLLSLISLHGDVHVDTNGLVQASLVALEGSIHLPASARIEGAVAAKELDLLPGDPTEGRMLSWNAALDPTDHRAATAALRIGDDGDWRTYVP